MTDYSAILSLFKMLQVPDRPLKLWSKDAGCEVACCIANVLNEKTTSMIAKANYISVSVDEVTSVNCQSWIFQACVSCSKLERGSNSS